MLEAVFANGAVLKKLVDAIQGLCKDINLDCSEDGISVQAMDGSHVALVSLCLKSGDKGAFESFRCDRQQSIGVSTESLAKILKLCSNEDKVKFVVEENADHIVFTFENFDTNKSTDFELKMLDIENEALGIPEQEYTTEIDMPSKEFANIVRDVSVFGDTVTMNVSKGVVKFQVAGDIGKGNISLKPRESVKEEFCVVIRVEEPIVLSFALRYLNSFAKAAPLSDKVKLQISDGVPMVVSFTLENEDKGHLNFFLAPKIDDE
jgi:proliferating cell nuclear antigen